MAAPTASFATAEASVPSDMVEQDAQHPAEKHHQNDLEARDSGDLPSRWPRLAQRVCVAHGQYSAPK
jgi:hypothetical protein